MSFFSKNACTFCGKEVGFIKGKKLNDGNHICSECEKNCSAYIDVSRYTKDFLTEHMEYMQKQDKLYKSEVEPLGKGGVNRIINAYNGIIFIDSIDMFEAITPKYSKKNQKELFRYDQIKDFAYYQVKNNSDRGKKYSEVGLDIFLKSEYTADGFKDPLPPSGKVHPYVALIRISFEKDTDDALAAGRAKDHLNELFGRPSETFGGSIKEAFTGTGQERADMKAQAETVKALGGLAKSFLQKDSAAVGQAQENLKMKTQDAVSTALDYGSKYTETADAAERRAWQ